MQIEQILQAVKRCHQSITKLCHNFTYMNNTFFVQPCRLNLNFLIQSRIYNYTFVKQSHTLSCTLAAPSAASDWLGLQPSQLKVANLDGSSAFMFLLQPAAVAREKSSTGSWKKTPESLLLYFKARIQNNTKFH